MTWGPLKAGDGVHDLLADEAVVGLAAVAADPGDPAGLREVDAEGIYSGRLPDHREEVAWAIRNINIVRAAAPSVDETIDFIKGNKEYAL